MRSDDLVSTTRWEPVMPHYAALDVSNEETAIHVLDETGRTVWRGKRTSEPEALATALRRHAPDLVRVGWRRLPDTLALPQPQGSRPARHLPGGTPCTSRHALQRNKTDANDAETLAQLVRTGWYREARVKSFAAHAVRHLVGARAQLKGMSVDLSNQIRSILKTFGLMAGKGAGHTFAIRVQELLEGGPRWLPSLTRCLPPGRPCASRLRCSTDG
jgi:transposase